MSPKPSNTKLSFIMWSKPFYMQTARQYTSYSENDHWIGKRRSADWDHMADCNHRHPEEVMNSHHFTLNDYGKLAPPTPTPNNQSTNMTAWWIFWGAGSSCTFEILATMEEKIYCVPPFRTQEVTLLSGGVHLHWLCARYKSLLPTQEERDPTSPVTSATTVLK